jgi:hypothetical protein
MRRRRHTTVQQVFITRFWAAGSGPMGCLGDDDMVCDATIEEMLQAVFSVSPLGVPRGYIILPTWLNSGSTVSAVSAVQWNGVSCGS